MCDLSHFTAGCRKSRGVGDGEDERPDLAVDSVNGVIITIPVSVHYKQEVTRQAPSLLFFFPLFASFMSFICQCHTIYYSFVISKLD